MEGITAKLSSKELKKQIKKLQEQNTQAEAILKVTKDPEDKKKLQAAKKEIEERLKAFQNDLKVVDDADFKKALGVKDKSSINQSGDFATVLTDGK